MSEPRRWVTEGPLRLNVEVVEACAYDALAARVREAESERDERLTQAEGVEIERELREAAARVRELEASQALAVKDRNEAEDENVRLDGRVRELEGALHQMAAPRRPDGTYNLSREACEQIANEILASCTPESE